MHIYDVIIIGAGPCGLACGIEAQKNSLDYLIVDKGNITESVRRYPVNMTFFSTSENIEIGDVPFISQGTRPNRTEALKYYRKVCSHFKLNIKLFTEIKNVEQTAGYFALTDNLNKQFFAAKVIFSTGYYDVPRRLDIPGENLPHVSHYYDEAYRYTLTKTVVVGGANSAIEAALDLYRNGAEVTVVHMLDWLDKRGKYWIVPDLENRIKKQEVNAYFKTVVTKIEPGVVYIKNLETAEESTLEADFVFLMTGYKPDADFLTKVGIQLNGENLIPELNPETYESNIPGIYLAGSIVGGEETAKIFIENGKLHAQPVIRDIVKKMAEKKAGFTHKVH
ncbi:MAG: YpdA family putative bacillithiol disulfide reductase [Cyclobacteriaceae bacterium]